MNLLTCRRIGGGERTVIFHSKQLLSPAAVIHSVFLSPCHQLRHVSRSSLPLPLCSQLTRLDENRARCQLALKSGKFYTSVSRVAIWGNHSTTQVGEKGV